jgi:hypothetical protein
MFTDDWNELTPDQRFAARMDAWQNAPIEFVSPEVEQAYRERVQLFRDAIELKKPARVPIAPWIGLYPLRYAGYTGHDAYYDRAKLATAWDKYHQDFQADGLAVSAVIIPGKLFEILDFKMYQWPGNGTPDDSSYQYTEKEWMKDNEYDLLINDPSSYWQRFYLPRMFAAFEPMQTLAPFTDLIEMPFDWPFFLPFALPAVKEMLQKMMAAGDLAMEWLQTVMAIDGKQIATLGIPGLAGGASKAPYDVLGDTMRGTRGLMLDKFRRPEKLLEACERLVPLLIDWGVRAADANRHPLVFIPIHKGADGFLSDADYRAMYWPTFKKVLLGLIEQGVVPLVFAEGAYNERLEAIHDPEIPAGRMIWMFDATDMREARKHLGGYQCFGGNVPGSLLTMGTPDRVDAYVKALIADVAGDGGFILGSGIVLDEADPACLKALIDAGRRYGAAV